MPLVIKFQILFSNIWQNTIDYWLSSSFAIDTIDYCYTPNICLSLCSNTCTFKWLSFNFCHAVSLSYLFKNIKRYTSILYNREDLMKKAGNISRKNLLSMGTCFGKMTKAGKFRLQITALDFMAPYAKVWEIFHF